MSELPATVEPASLPGLVDRAAQVLASARTSAEVLEAREMAGLAYDAAKRAVRLAKAKQSHDDLIQKVYRAQADALEIESRAKRLLADEYDAAQERGEVARLGDNLPSVPERNAKPTAADIGLTRKQIHEARTIRDAEAREPGIVRRVAQEAIAKGEEPSRSKVRRAVREAAGRLEPVARPVRGKEAICARVKDAIVVLAGLPAPHEVVGYFRGTDHAVIIDERLPNALRWLSEFDELWGDDNA